MDEYKERFAQALKLVTETLKLANVLLALAITLGVAGSIVALATRVWNWLLVGALLAGLFVIGYVVVRRDKARFGKPKKYFRIKRLEVSLNVSKGNDIVTTRIERFVLVALVDDLTFFADTIVWDGRGRIEYSTDVAGHTVRERGFLACHGYEVRFGRSLRKGEEVNIEVRCLMQDFGQQSTNLLMKEIRYPTDHLLLQVNLPAEKSPNAVTHHTYTCLTAHWSFDTDGAYSRLEDGSVQVSREIERPAQMRCYAIRWTTPGAH
jgi:hypothetical protein